VDRFGFGYTLFCGCGKLLKRHPPIGNGFYVFTDLFVGGLEFTIQELFGK
jgi:hypothetical protein